MIALSVAVHQLCELMANQGTLDSRFLPAIHGLEGVFAKKAYQRRQPETYQREVKVTGRWQALTVPKSQLRLTGRINGVGILENGRDYLEELKVLKIAIEQLPESVEQRHFAQLQVYAYLWCETNQVTQVELRLTYLDERGGILRQTIHDYHHDQDALCVTQWFTRYLDWFNHYQQLISERNASLVDLPFPYPQFRAGQRRLATGVYRTIEQGRQLLVEAPTGIGKTLATLYPAVRWLGQRIDKIAYVTAKNSTQNLPQLAIKRLQVHGAKLRVITLTGKRRACLNSQATCQSTCPYAADFYDKFYELAPQLMSSATLDAMMLQRLGQSHTICPYYLALLLGPWFDVVIADYNYALDGENSLNWLVEPTGEVYSLLIDEAHNVNRRARDLYSASVSHNELKALAKEPLSMGVRQTLRSLRAQFSQLINRQLASGAFVTIDPPSAFLRRAQRFTAAVELQFAEQNDISDFLLDVYFKVYRLLELAERFAAHYQYQLSCESSSHGDRPAWIKLKLACLDPAPELHKRLSYAQSSICFSATLQPLASSAHDLGLSSQHYQLSLPSPYAPERQGVWLITDIATRYRQRQHSLRRLAQLICDTFQAQQVNQLVFFPSFSYLRAVRDAVTEIDETINLLEQRVKMSDPQRHGFIEQLSDIQAPTLGLAVLGGVFSEGIDLGGRQLSSVMIVGVGLAQINTENEQQRQYIDAQGEDGFALVYQYPGMQRVVQAAGRVIRSAKDCGTVMLIDERYRQLDYQVLLPAHWQWQMIPSHQLVTRITQFWKGFNPLDGDRLEARPSE